MINYGIGTTDRKNLAAHITHLSDVLDEDAKIYKRVLWDQYYVGHRNTNPTDLKRCYGGDWIYLTDLTVHDYEITEVQSYED
jgi:hypothetical protein